METSSLTAYFVTASVARLAALPRWSALVDPEARALAEAFAARAPDAWSKRALSRAPASLLVGLTDTFFVRGMSFHYLFRKRLIEDEARRAIAAGARQVLVLGGGFDSLCLRLARAHTSVTAVEIDLPQTQSRKRAVLREIHYEIPSNCHFVEADLSTRALRDVLASIPALDPHAPTLVVIEGVLMYLREPAVRALFAALDQHFSAALSVVFGAIAVPDTEGSWQVQWANRWLSTGGEATHWACAPSEMQGFLSSIGYSLERAERYKAMQRAHRSERELRRVPEDDENYYVATRAGRS